MMNKFKKYINKLNALLENGLIITRIGKNQIIINDLYVIDIDDNYLYFHLVNGKRNYNFMGFDTLDFKTMKMYIDNLMYDIFHINKLNLSDMF